MSSEVKLATKNDKLPHTLLPVPAFSAYMVVRLQSVDLIDLHSSKIMHTFMTEPMQLHSLKFVFSGRRLAPGGRGTVSSLTLAYNSEETGDCVLQTYLPDENFDNICFSNANGPPGRSSCSWNETRQITRRMSNPGSWTPLRNGSIVGVRRVQEAPRGSPIRDRLPAFAQNGLRHRAVAARDEKNDGHASSTHKNGYYTAPRLTTAKQAWETWVMTRLEQEASVETKLCDDSAGLIISELGPMIKVGYGSVAVGFGNIIKVITVGHEWYGTAEEENLQADTSIIASRRRRGPASRTRATSATFRLPDER